MAGRLTGTADGRPIELIAEAHALVIRPASLAHAWRLRRCWPHARGLAERLTLLTGADTTVALPKLPA